MKNKWLLAALLAGNSWFGGWATDVDPVIMRVNNKDIHKSEFEYIYNKNSQQQIDHKSLDEYVTLFKNYKLKVAEAEAMGIDTTSAFKNELAGYREELAKPYLIDASVDDRLAHEAYDRMKEDVEVSHILIGLNARTPEERAEAKKKPNRYWLKSRRVKTLECWQRNSVKTDRGRIRDIWDLLEADVRFILLRRLLSHYKREKFPI